MRTYKEIYGQDIDGNRGIVITNAELDEYDYDWIYESIAGDYDPEREYYTVWNTDDEGNEFEFEVNIKDWLTLEDIAELNKEIK